jgi:Type ISP C-terminal specificity domain
MSRLLINQYRQQLETRKRYGGSNNEGAIRYAFATLLNSYCQPRDFILVEELTIVSRLQTKIRLDGIVKDALRLDWGYWEAKDEKDSLDAEIEAKLSKGYPTDNILFEDSKTAVLIQNNHESLRINMEDDDPLDALLKQFLDYERAEVKDFRQAISNFSQDLPIIINTLRTLIDRQDLTPSPSPEGEGGEYLTPSPSPKSEGRVISTDSNSPLPQGEGLGVRAKVKLKADKVNHKIIIDEITTLENIPPLAWEYKLGNRSALEWILDQYTEKFNNYRFADYKEEVIELLKRVCTVSVETMKIIEKMNAN